MHFKVPGAIPGINYLYLIMDNKTKDFYGFFKGYMPNTFTTDINKYSNTDIEYDTISIVPTNKPEAVKYDANKTDWSLMPFEVIEEINKVLEFGAGKYSAHNWKQGEGFKYSRVLNSLLRHVFAYMRGEDKDPESGLSHLAHAGCNIVFLLYYNKYKDRYKNDDRVNE